jgi:hypothetical protein
MIEYTITTQEAFVQFWVLYPKNMGKKYANVMWKMLTIEQKYLFRSVILGNSDL